MNAIWVGPTLLLPDDSCNNLAPGASPFISMREFGPAPIVRARLVPTAPLVCLPSGQSAPTPRVNHYVSIILLICIRTLLTKQKKNNAMREVK